jgi:hypothetical protein
MSIENYEPVAVRIDKFWKAYPNGRIHTDLVEFSSDRVIARAEIYADREDTRPVAVDFALEVQGSSNVNKHFHLEACITSAIGRALATFNIQGDPSKLGADARPSREEMTKVARTSNGAPARETIQQGDVTVTQFVGAGTASDKQKWAIKGKCKELGKLPPGNLDSLSKQEASDLIGSLEAEIANGRAAEQDLEEPF